MFTPLPQRALQSTAASCPSLPPLQSERTFNSLAAQDSQPPDAVGAEEAAPCAADASAATFRPLLGRDSASILAAPGEGTVPPAGLASEAVVPRAAREVGAAGAAASGVATPAPNSNASV